MELWHPDIQDLRSRQLQELGYNSATCMTDKDRHYPSTEPVTDWCLART